MKVALVATIAWTCNSPLEALEVLHQAAGSLVGRTRERHVMTRAVGEDAGFFVEQAACKPAFPIQPQRQPDFQQTCRRQPGQSVEPIPDQGKGPSATAAMPTRSTRRSCTARNYCWRQITRAVPSMPR